MKKAFKISIIKSKFGEGGEKVINPIIERIKETVDMNLEYDMSLAEIAKSIGISIYYMSHIFKKHTGMTVVEYRTLKRIDKAKELLSTTGLSVTEIAFRCGFSSQGYFSERFSKVCGVPPTKFRNGKTE